MTQIDIDIKLGGPTVNLSQSLLLKLMKENGVTQVELANKVNVNKSTISRFINGKTELSFDFMLKIASAFPEHTIELMEAYIREVELAENIKKSLEYSSINRMLDSSRKLVERTKSDEKNSSEEDELHEWVNVYQIYLEYQMGIFPEDELLDKLPDQFTSDEMRVFVQFLRTYFLTDTSKRNYILKHSEALERKIDQLSDGYIKSSFLIRIYSQYMYSYLLQYNDVEKGRYYANELIRLTDSSVYVIFANNQLGVSYIFQDYNMSLGYFEKAKEIAIKNNSAWEANRKFIEKNIVFLKNVWNKFESVPETCDQSEIAHYLIKSGNSEEGLRILNTLEESPFRMYYRWLGTNDVEHLYRSIYLFKQNNGYFFMHGLIYPELLKIGYDPTAAELMCM